MKYLYIFIYYFIPDVINFKNFGVSLGSLNPLTRAVDYYISCDNAITEMHTIAVNCLQSVLVDGVMHGPKVRYIYNR